MGSSVEPDAVAGLSKQLDRLAEHATQGKSYVATHTDLDLTGEGIINLIEDVADPTARYKPPQDYNAEMPYEPHWSDLASPTGFLRDAIWTVTDFAASLGICDRA